MRMRGFAGVLTGAVFCIVSLAVMLGVGMPLLDSLLSRSFGPDTVDGVTRMSGAEQNRASILRIAYVVAVGVVVFFAGGVISGRLSERSHGSRGAMSGLIVIVCGLVGMAAWYSPVLLQTLDNPDPGIRSGNMGLISFAILASVITLLPAPLLGYLGGVLGGRTRTES